MPFDRHLIASYQTGLQKDVRQWRLMDDAFHVINNAYVWRGRVRKRFGSFFMGDPDENSQLMSRLRVNIGNTPGPLNIDGLEPLLEIGQIFSVANASSPGGVDIFTIITLSPAAGALTLSTNPGATATIVTNVTPNTVTFTGETPGTPVFWYPSFPVMGLTQFETGGFIDDYPSYAFDPYFAYVFTPGVGWDRSIGSEWNGQMDPTFINFFWATNWRGTTGSGSGANIAVMYVTNFQVTNKNGAGVTTDDVMWFLEAGVGWTPLDPASGFFFAFFPNGGARASSPYVFTARIILPFKRRLILLNTVENDNSAGNGINSWYPNRCRFSWNGNPLADQAFYEPNQVDAAGNKAAGGGFIDAATDEQIVSAEFIKDRLIVYFERSTWELAYTGNENEPFSWNKLNTELGSQSTFSTVAFDKEVLSVGYTGIHACNGSNVARIDQVIPDEVFQLKIENENAIRIAGIRDYRLEMVYWSVPYANSQSTQLFPNKVLVYNYRQPAWAYNDDTFTTFGYFEQGQDNTATWAGLNMQWQQNSDTWESDVSPAGQIQILAGNQEGFVVVLDPGTTWNAANLQVTNIVGNVVTVINHNLIMGDWVYFEDTGTALDGLNFQILSVTQDTFTISTSITGTYLGGGYIGRISVIDIQTKQWNPYDKQDRNVYLHKIDFAVQKTATGQITVDYFPSSTNLSMLNEGTATNSITGTGILETSPYSPTFYPLEKFQNRLWHPIYFQTDGECIQLRMYFSTAQMADTSIPFEDFELEAFLLYTEATTDRLQ